MFRMKITTTCFCPHCKKETEVMRLELDKYAIYVCCECLMEPTKDASLKIFAPTIIGNLEKLISTLKQNIT